MSAVSRETAPREVSDDQSRSTAGRPAQAPSGDGPFDWRGWVLVGVVVVAFLVIPVSILLVPQAQAVLGTFNIPWQDAYWALPMIPAILLGATAVWAAVSSRRK